VTVEQAAKELEVSAALIYRLCRAGKLGHVRIGLRRGVVRISAQDIEDFQRGHRVEMVSGDEGERGGETVRMVRGDRLVIPDYKGELKRTRERERAERKAAKEVGYTKEAPKR
jgi:excisionase family DNA binding protein